MRYFDDMIGKWGFSDGDALPDGVDVYRELYVKAINHYAEIYGSAYRAHAYDRGGMHNCCLIIFLPKEESGTSMVVRPTLINETDGPLRQAVERVYELEVDTCVEVVVTPDYDALEDLLVNNSDDNDEEDE